jgi:hypothetical protein
LKLTHYQIVEFVYKLSKNMHHYYMVNEQLVQQIRDALAAGKFEESVKDELREQGWDDVTISDSFSQAQSVAFVYHAPEHIANLTGPRNASSTAPRPNLAYVAYGLIVLALLLLIGAGGYLGYVVYFEQGLQLATRAIDNLQQLQSYQTSGQLKIEAEGDFNSPSQLSQLHQFPFINLLVPSIVHAANSSGSASITYSGFYNAKDPQQVDLDMDFDMELEGQQSYENINVGGGFSFAAKMRLIDSDEIYIQMTKMPSIDELGLSLSPYMNEWIRFSISEALPTMSPASPSFPEDDFNDRLQSINQSIATLYSEYPFLVFERGDDHQKIAGVDTLHFTYTIDTAVLQQYFQRLNLILEDELLTDTQKDLYLQSDNPFNDPQTQQFFESFDTFQGSVWVGKDDAHLYRIGFDWDFVVPDTSDAQVRLIIQGTQDYSQHNADIPINPPADYLDYMEMMQEMYPGYSMDSPSSSLNDPIDPQELVRSSRDSQRFSDLSNLKKSIDASLAKGAELPICVNENIQNYCGSYPFSGQDKTAVDGTGWLPMDLSEYFTKLPVDPRDGEFFLDHSGQQVAGSYIFWSDGQSYKLATFLESSNRFAQDDGGNIETMFEIGNGLDTFPPPPL